MKVALLLVFFSVLFSACSESKNEKKEPVPETETKITEPASFDGCYEMVIAGDTAFMKLKQSGDSLAGDLRYKRKEKDSNIGNVVLKKIDSRGEGYYTFQSEGKTSVRQIIFKINGSSFAEGYGDIEMKNDTAVLKYPHALNFEEKHPFNKVTCK